MKADNKVFLFSTLMMALGLGGMQATLAEDVFKLRPLPVEKHEFPKVQEVDTTLHVYIKPALPHPPPPSTPTHVGSDLQKQGGKPSPTPTNPGDPRPEAKPWLGVQEPQAKGIKIPDPKAGDRTVPGVMVRESPTKQSPGIMYLGSGGGAGKVIFQDFHFKESKGTAGVQPDTNMESGQPAGLEVAEPAKPDLQETNRIKLPNPKAGDRTDPNALSHTVPPPKIGNDKSVKADVSPGGFGTGMNTSSGANAGVGMNPDMRPVMSSPAPSLPAMSESPMSPAMPTPMGGGYRP